MNASCKQFDESKDVAMPEGEVPWSERKKRTVKVSKDLRGLLKWLTLASLSALQTGRSLQAVVLDTFVYRVDSPLGQTLL